jgi:hypothetical protein
MTTAGDDAGGLNYLAVKGYQRIVVSVAVPDGKSGCKLINQDHVRKEMIDDAAVFFLGGNQISQRYRAGLSRWGW